MSHRFNNLVQELYSVEAEEREAFGPAWIGPAKYLPGKWTQVALYRGVGDGQHVTVQCAAMPARYYRLVVAETVRANGEFKNGFVIGSSGASAELVAQVAHAISQGVLHLQPPG